jgi:hypothetical protein
MFYRIVGCDYRLQKGFRSVTHMDKLTVFIALIIFQTTSLTWAATYQLHLQNGNELRTSYYWEEGDEIKFYVYGGVAGIQKEFITRVTITKFNSKEDTGYKEEVVGSQTSSHRSGQKSTENSRYQAGDSDSTAEGSAQQGEVVDLKYYRQRKAILKEKLEDALQRNREATARQDQDAKEQTRREYLDFSKQIIALGDELKKRNKDVLPDWWEE